MRLLGSALFPPAAGVALLAVLHRLSETSGGAAVNVAGMIVGMATMILGIRGISMISTAIRDRAGRKRAPPGRVTFEHSDLNRMGYEVRPNKPRRYLVLRVDVSEAYCPDIDAVSAHDLAAVAYDRAEDINRAFRTAADPAEDGYAMVVDLLTLAQDPDLTREPVKREERRNALR